MKSLKIFYQFVKQNNIYIDMIQKNMKNVKIKLIHPPKTNIIYISKPKTPSASTFHKKH